MSVSFAFYSIDVSNTLNPTSKRPHEQVSWIRRKDLNVLSVGLARYTQDPRFSVIHAVGSDLWTLQLAYPTAEDSGVYECQVGTLPKISRQVTLNVIGKYQHGSSFFDPR